MSYKKSKKPYNFTHRWDIKLKATHEETRKANKNSQTQTAVQWLSEGRELGEVVKGKGGQIYGDKEI